MPRTDNRAADQLRPVEFHPQFLHNAPGSVLVAMGNTRVICSATVVDRVPKWMYDKGMPGGWVTAEYAMLPGATNSRKQRPISRGMPDARSLEIQRLVGRSLRAIVQMDKLGQHTIYVDCDVIDADGGTRCASVTGGAVALQLALRKMFLEGKLSSYPVNGSVAAVSVGVVKGEAVLDLDYAEDSAAAVDMNVVMTAGGRLVEVQGTAEEGTFGRDQMTAMLDLAETGIRELLEAQKTALANASGQG